MKWIVAPMVGGTVSSTILTRIVIPAVYSPWKELQLKRASRDVHQVPFVRQPAPVVI